jgi:hypothetical protein
MKYVEGDLFAHVPTDGFVTIIPHVCNSIGAWGSGFVIPLGKRYPNAKKLYKESSSFQLGLTIFASDHNNILVANMIAQEGIGPKIIENKIIPPIRYDYLQKCMDTVREKAEQLKKENKMVKIACPMFGSGLAGGDWSIIEKMIAETWKDIDTTVYYL